AIYQRLFKAYGNVDHLRSSIGAAEQAALLSDDDPAQEAVRTAQLGVALCIARQHFGEASLGRGLACLEKALTLAPVGSEARVLCQAYMSLGLQAEYQMTGRAELLDRAIAMSEGSDDFTDMTPAARAELSAALGNALMLRYARRGDLLDLEKACR